jgi:peptidoglycan/xylan/chitin deacetylase (PgdA/CDA1 family)
MAALPILTFHSVDDRTDVLSFPPRLFEWGLARLHEAGYRTVPLTLAVDKLCAGGALPERSLVITFDDGYRSVHEHALPALHRFGMCATLFLIAGSHEGRQPARLGRAMLSWSEVRELQHAGLTIGAHTVTHPDLRRLPLAQAAEEMRESKTRIEQALGVAVTSFAYPNGYHDAPIRRLARDYFSCACADRLGLATPASDRYALERVESYYLRSERLFGTVLSRHLPLYLRAIAIPRRLRRAVRAWRDPVAPASAGRAFSDERAQS